MVELPTLNPAATKAENTEKKVPDYAHTVVVPIANPKTAPELLTLAHAIVQRDGGRIIALAVTLSDSDAEVNRERLDTLEEIVEARKPKPKAQAEPLDAEDADADRQDDTEEPAQKPKNPEKEQPHIVLEFVTRTAMNIARGILDQARESGAELIILGVQKSSVGSVVLGSVAQAVMSAAPCDVLVYRYSVSPSFNRIVVPVDGSPASRMAVRMGILFANSQKHCPVEAVHVYSSGRPAYEGRARIEETLDGVPGRGVVKGVPIQAHDPAAAILSRVDEDHLVVMGFSRRSEFERWLSGEQKNMRDLLDKAPGPVLLAVRSTEVVTARQRLMRRVFSWLRPQLTDIEQEQVVWDAYSNSGTDLDYVVLMLISATLASLGLLLNSAAVVIGAMLVAPLMSPLNAFGLGLSTARLDLTRRASLSVVIGVVIASLVSITIGVIVPLETPTSEMMSRVSPTLLDAFVALASGIVGSYATVRKDIPAALAGVAIAAALVPPICTFGLQLAFGEWRLALGAMLLFLTNIFSIVFIASLVFVWVGLRPDATSVRRRAYISLLIFVAITLSTVYAVLATTERANLAQSIEQEIRQLFTPVQVMGLEVIERDPVMVTTTLRTPNEISQEAIVAAQDHLTEQFGAVRLEVIVEQLLLSPEAEADWIADHTFAPQDEVPLGVEAGEIVPAPVTEEAPVATEEP